MGFSAAYSVGDVHQVYAVDWVLVATGRIKMVPESSVLTFLVIMITLKAMKAGGTRSAAAPPDHRSR